MYPDTIRLKEIKPVIEGCIRDSLSMLTSDSFPSDQVIHDVRVLMKKSRSALKLVASHLDTEFIYMDINAQRKIGRKMCVWREDSVMRKKMKSLKKEYPELFSRLDDNEKINFILHHHAAPEEPSEKSGKELGEIAALLRRTGFRIRFQPIKKIEPQLLLGDLEETYAKVKDTYLICRTNPGRNKLHEFRKRTKEFLYQLDFFKPLNPNAIKKVERKLVIISRYLGRHNDLSQLLQKIDCKYSCDKNLPALDELVIRLREKQDKYLSKVWPAASKIFFPGEKLENILGFKSLAD